MSKGYDAGWERKDGSTRVYHWETFEEAQAFLFNELDDREWEVKVNVLGGWEPDTDHELWIESATYDAGNEWGWSEDDYWRWFQSNEYVKLALSRTTPDNWNGGAPVWSSGPLNGTDWFITPCDLEGEFGSGHPHPCADCNPAAVRFTVIPTSTSSGTINAGLVDYSDIVAYGLTSDLERLAYNLNRLEALDNE